MKSISAFFCPLEPVPIWNGFFAYVAEFYDCLCISIQVSRRANVIISAKSILNRVLKDIGIVILPSSSTLTIASFGNLSTKKYSVFAICIPLRTGSKTTLSPFAI